VRNEEVIQRVKETNVLQTNILRRNCLLKHVIEGKIQARIEVTGRRRRRRKHYWMTLRNRQDREIETGSTRSHSGELTLE
jgi:hypothetical protein